MLSDGVKFSKLSLQRIAWLISCSAALLAVIVWEQSRGWRLSGLSLYNIFPLLGLLAFSLMWAHYMASALRVYSRHKEQVLEIFYSTTSRVVLALILLHPGLLAYQLWRDGFGAPPSSYLNYVQSSSQLFIVFGIVALLSFLLYDLKPLLRRWPIRSLVDPLGDIAMILVLIHSLNLGTDLQTTAHRALWYFYGVTLIASMVYTKYVARHKGQAWNPTEE